MEILTLIQQTPTYTWLVLAGIAIVFFTYFEISTGSVKLRSFESKSYLMPLAMDYLKTPDGNLLIQSLPSRISRSTV